jgi:hypothetical protein
LCGVFRVILHVWRKYADQAASRRKQVCSAVVIGRRGGDVKLLYAREGTHLHVWRQICLVLPPSRGLSLPTTPGCTKG